VEEPIFVEITAEFRRREEEGRRGRGRG
jgi:hypothetical protein